MTWVEIAAELGQAPINIYDAFDGLSLACRFIIQQTRRWQKETISCVVKWVRIFRHVIEQNKHLASLVKFYVLGRLVNFAACRLSCERYLVTWNKSPGWEYISFLTPLPTENRCKVQRFSWQNGSQHISWQNVSQHVSWQTGIQHISWQNGTQHVSWQNGINIYHDKLEVNMPHNIMEVTYIMTKWNSTYIMTKWKTTCLMTKWNQHLSWQTRSQHAS